MSPFDDEATIAIDPNDADTRYIGNFQGIRKTTDGGGHWSTVLQTSVDIVSLAIDPGSGDVFAGTGRLEAGRVAAGEPRRRLDVGTQRPGLRARGGQGDRSTRRRDGVGRDRPRPGPIRGRRADWALGEVAVPVGAGGLDVSSAVHFVGGYAFGIWRDDGAGWALAHQGRFEDHFFRVVVAPSNHDIIYALTLPRRLERSDDGGAHRTSVHDFGETGPAWITVDPSNPMNIYASGIGVMKSFDGGVHWVSASRGIPAAARLFTHAVIDPRHRQRLFASSFDGVYRSTDGGATWTRTSDGLPNVLGDTSVDDVLIDPTSPTLLFAATSRGIFRSADSGRHWQLQTRSPAATRLAVDPSDPSRVWCLGYRRGSPVRVFRSSDAGLPGRPCRAAPMASCSSTSAWTHRERRLRVVDRRGRVPADPLRATPDRAAGSGALDDREPGRDALLGGEQHAHSHEVRSRSPRHRRSSRPDLLLADPARAEVPGTRSLKQSSTNRPPGGMTSARSPT